MYRRQFISSFVSAILFANVVQAQKVGVGPVAPAVVPQGAVYRLNETSEFERGCFPPCRCALWQSGGMRGTFVLRQQTHSGDPHVWMISDISWFVPTDADDIQITGTGKLQIGGQPLQHRLELDVHVSDSDAGVQHLDSGWLDGNAGFPNLSITVSEHGMFCFDTVLIIDASPVPAAELVRYRLDATQSTFQQGCFGACACPLGPELALAGRFALVKIQENPLFTEYAVVDANFVAYSTTFPFPPVRVRGLGTYQVGGEVAVVERLKLDVRVDEGPVLHLDSGWDEGGTDFPHLDSTVSIPDAICFDAVIHVVANPV